MKFDLIMTLINGVFQALIKYPEFIDEWQDVKAEWEEAVGEESEGGNRITLGEFFNEIFPEFKEAIMVFVPDIDDIIELLTKK
jgi:hypothetical protein